MSESENKYKLGEDEFTIEQLKEGLPVPFKCKRDEKGRLLPGQETKPKHLRKKRAKKLNLQGRMEKALSRVKQTDLDKLAVNDTKEFLSLFARMKRDIPEGTKPDLQFCFFPVYNKNDEELKLSYLKLLYYLKENNMRYPSTPLEDKVEIFNEGKKYINELSSFITSSI